jgi:hypothetical protein
VARIGETRCINPKCTCTDVAVNETASGNYSATCHKCGAPWFAKKGTKWRRDLDGQPGQPGLLRRDQDEAAPPPPLPGHQVQQLPAPPAAPKRSGMLLL